MSIPGVHENCITEIEHSERLNRALVWLLFASILLLVITNGLMYSIGKKQGILEQRCHDLNGHMTDDGCGKFEMVDTNKAK